MASFEVLRAGAAGASDSGSVEPAAPARSAPVPRKASAGASAAVSTALPASAAAGAAVSTPGHRQRKVLAALAPWALPVALVVFWQVAAHVGWLSSRILPEPWQVLTAFWTLAESGELWAHLRTSLWRAAVGFGIGAGLGLLLGLLTGTLRAAETALDTTLQMIRNIPALALIPLVILWFGIDTFIFSGYPHLEESYRFAELVFPLLGKGKESGEQSITGPFGEMMASDILPKKAA